ncbi:MAG: TIGR04104 family putative zinc finger protein [Bacillota bacterium]|nr:TIGR04104 family putative zinc finger protein [Bacillota bacterium]
MNTPTCANCHKQWSWKMTWKKTFTFKQAITCPFCEEKQYITKSARQKLCLLPIIFPIINVPFLSFGVSSFYLAMVYIICVVVLVIGMPFFYRLSNKEEPLW